MDKNNSEDINKYEDTEGITLKKLSFGLWYVEHGKLFKNIAAVFLLVVSAVSWAYTIYGFAHYIIKGMDEDNMLVNKMAETGFINHAYIIEASAKDLAVERIDVLRSGDKKIDFSAKISNPNTRHWAEFRYIFTDGRSVTEDNYGFILPGETKFLFSLAQDAGRFAGNSRIKIEGISWHRLNIREIPDWNAFRKNRMDIGISGTKLSPSSENSVLGIGKTINYLEFMAKNDSAYNYWNVDFMIVLYGGPDNIAGVNKYSLAEFMSGKTQNVKMAWPGEFPSASEIEIIPEVNIMKKDAYIKYDGGIGEAK